MANQESYDYLAHYDPKSGEIVEPLQTLRVNDLIEAVTGNGITVDGDLFMANGSTMQLDTVQGVGGATIDFIDDINFDSNSGVKFGTGTKLSSYVEDTFTATLTGAITTTATWKYVKIGKNVTLHFPTESAATAAGNMINVSGIPAEIRPVTLNVYFPVTVRDNNVLVSGLLLIDTVGTAQFGVGPTAANFAGPAASGYLNQAVSYVL